MTPLVFCDLETTGLDPQRHEIWDVGLIVENSPDAGEYQWYLPVTLKTAEPMALKVGRLYERHPQFQGDLVQSDRYYDTLESPHVDEIANPKRVAHKIARLTNGAHLVGNVVSFDAAFLDVFMRKYGAAPCWHYHLVDCEALVAGHLQVPPPWKSSELSEAAGIRVPDETDHHTALGDAKWARDLYYSVMV